MHSNSNREWSQEGTRYVVCSTLCIVACAFVCPIHHTFIARLLPSSVSPAPVCVRSL
ncbi:hypothetical protein BD309DRAFT_962925 [Dichomitus squalens]|nr:hypothetical protein BD309DRAFT_962925 [Dichomitus squalens]